MDPMSLEENGVIVAKPMEMAIAKIIAKETESLRKEVKELHDKFRQHVGVTKEQPLRQLVILVLYELRNAYKPVTTNKGVSYTGTSAFKHTLAWIQTQQQSKKLKTKNHKIVSDKVLSFFQISGNIEKITLCRNWYEIQNLAELIQHGILGEFEVESQDREGNDVVGSGRIISEVLHKHFILSSEAIASTIQCLEDTEREIYEELYSFYYE